MWEGLPAGPAVAKEAASRGREDFLSLSLSGFSTNAQSEMRLEKKRLGFLAVQDSVLQICSVALLPLMLLFGLIFPFAPAGDYRAETGIRDLT